MIVTLTPNPSVDRTVSITDLQRGEVQRATASRIDPGGKGVNISRALTAHKARTLAVLPAGGPQGTSAGRAPGGGGHRGHHRADRRLDPRQPRPGRA